MIKSETVHARLAMETKQLAEVCAASKRMSVSAFYRLAIEEAVTKYRPTYKVAGPELVEES